MFHPRLPYRVNLAYWPLKIVRVFLFIVSFSHPYLCTLFSRPVCPKAQAHKAGMFYLGSWHWLHKNSTAKKKHLLKRCPWFMETYWTLAYPNKSKEAFFFPSLESSLASLLINAYSLKPKTQFSWSTLPPHKKPCLCMCLQYLAWSRFHCFWVQRFWLVSPESLQCLFSCQSSCIILNF